MVPEKYRLAAVGRFLLEQFELRRPGIRDWSPRAEASLRQEAESELQLMEQQLEALVGDLHRASETLETYRPLSELTHGLGLPSELAEAPPTAARERG